MKLLPSYMYSGLKLIFPINTTLHNKKHTYNFTFLFENALIILLLPANTDKGKKKKAN